jgi:hypothetical protein
MSGSPSNGGDPLIPKGTDPAARRGVAAPPIRDRASAGCFQGAASRRRCHAHTAAAIAAPSMRPAPPILLSHLVERRRTSAPVRCLRGARDGTNRRPGGGRGPARGGVAAPTSVAVVLGLHRVRSTALIDRCSGALRQRPHRFTWRLSFDGWALPFIHFGPGLPVRIRSRQPRRFVGDS